jgi:hypothetical protein
MPIGTSLSMIFLMLTVALDGIVIVTAAWAPLLEDNVSIRSDILGLPSPGARSWSDSYSDGDSCYCATTFDHNLAVVLVDTPLGIMTVKEVCDLLGQGPTGSRDGRPLYNDIQCGNGPSVISDEVACPGRTEYGQEGCKYIGPKWNFAPHLPPPPTPATKAPVKAPIKVPTKVPTKAPTKIVATLPTTSTGSTCKIVQFDMWDTVNKNLYQINIGNGTKICLNMEFSIDAIATSACTGYNVQFIVTGPNQYRYVHNEGQAPYCLYGNTGTTMYGKRLPTLGIYNVTVIPNPSKAGTGKTISLQVIRC